MANGIEAGTTNFATVAVCCTQVRINIGAVQDQGGSDEERKDRTVGGADGQSKPCPYGS
jgi:hypothetical protein